MANTYIFEGNTTNAAIENGLRELGVSRKDVEIKILEENKKSFFSILAPRIVRVEFTLKGNKEKNNKPKPEIDNEEIEASKKFIEAFLINFFESLNYQNYDINVKYEEDILKINLKGEQLVSLIGYRGETLNAFEIILNNVIKNNKFNVKVFCNINNYREKRNELLNQLAEKLAKTVIKKKKNITLEPMTPYERKIIHTKLQNNEYVKTYSIGEGSNRRLVISLK